MRSDACRSQTPLNQQKNNPSQNRLLGFGTSSSEENGATCHSSVEWREVRYKLKTYAGLLASAGQERVICAAHQISAFMTDAQGDLFNRGQEARTVIS